VHLQLIVKRDSRVLRDFLSTSFTSFRPISVGIFLAEGVKGVAQSLPPKNAPVGPDKKSGKESSMILQRGQGGFPNKHFFYLLVYCRISLTFSQRNSATVLQMVGVGTVVERRYFAGELSLSCA